MLSSVLDTVKQIAWTTSRVFHVDVIFADDKLNTLINTMPSYNDRIPVSNGSVMGSIVRTGQVMIINNRKKYYACKNCPDTANCLISGMVGVPIYYEKAVIGGMMLLIQADMINSIFSNTDNIVYFMQSMAELISSKVQTVGDFEKMNKVMMEKEMMLRANGDAVVCTDRLGFINSYNQGFVDTFGIDSDVQDKFIGTVIDFAELHSFLKTEQDVVDRLILMEHKGKSFYCYLTCKRVTMNGIHAGNVITFKLLRELRRMINQYRSTMETFSNFGNMIEMGYINEDLVSQINATPPEGSHLIFESSNTYCWGHVARALHKQRKSGEMAFYQVNCNEPRISTWLDTVFDETTGRPSLWGQAYFSILGGGTLYFADLDLMPLYLQDKFSKLLDYFETLQGAEFFQIIFSSQQNLDALVQMGYMKRSLRERMRFYTINLDAIFGDDTWLIPCIRRSFAFFCEKQGHRNTQMAEDTLHYIAQFTQESGILEMRLHLNRLLARRGDGGTLELEEVKNAFLHPGSEHGSQLSSRDLELSRIQQMLEQGYSKSEIADSLSISRATLYRRLKELV